MGEKATMKEVLPLMERARWIHIACHGDYSEKKDPHSVYSGLLHFTPDEAQHDDGKLFAETISKMKFEAEFAFIAACYSGRGNTAYSHEGLIGLTRALASGGVLTSASSYWKLPDTPETVRIIETFYTHVVGGVGKAKALQMAMREAINKKRDAPDLWGALFLTGID